MKKNYDEERSVKKFLMLDDDDDYGLNIENLTADEDEDAADDSEDEHYYDSENEYDDSEDGYDEDDDDDDGVAWWFRGLGKATKVLGVVILVAILAFILAGCHNDWWGFFAPSEETETVDTNWREKIKNSKKRAEDSVSKNSVSGNSVSGNSVSGNLVENLGFGKDTSSNNNSSKTNSSKSSTSNASKEQATTTTTSEKPENPEKKPKEKTENPENPTEEKNEEKPEENPEKPEDPTKKPEEKPQKPEEKPQKKKAVVQLLNDGKEYDGEEATIVNHDFEVVSGNLTKSELAPYVFSEIKEKGSDVGDYSIEGHCNNSEWDVTVLGATYTITRRSLSVKADNKQTYEGEPLTTLTYTITGGSIVNGDTVISLSTNATPSAIGEHAITINCVNSNYVLDTKEGTYRVKAKPHIPQDEGEEVKPSEGPKDPEEEIKPNEPTDSADESDTVPPSDGPVDEGEEQIKPNVPTPTVLVDDTDSKSSSSGPVDINVEGAEVIPSTATP